MPCQHTSYETVDGMIRCRSCGMSSTEVYYGVKVVRPEHLVLTGEVLGPTATQIRSGQAMRALLDDAYSGSFPQPRLNESPRRRPAARCGVIAEQGFGGWR